jgi:hypothetical protein
VALKTIPMSAPLRPGRKKWMIITGIVLGVLVIVRLILPYVILYYANRYLANDMKGYYGHIRTIDLALIRGAYKVDSLYLNKIDERTQKQTQFFSASLIDLSIEWKALFHGKIVGNVTVDHPELRFTKDKVDPKSLRKDSTSFTKLKKRFMPLEINRFEIRNGTLRFRDELSRPPVDISMTHTHILALNLRNSYDSAAVLPASVKAEADVYGGTLTFSMKLNPLAKDPTFEFKSELKETRLPELNNFFDAYADVKVSRGVFSMYTEVAAKQGHFAGYVKPIIKDLKVIGDANRHDPVLKKLWEGFVGTVATVLTNHKKDQLATKVPFEGELKEPDTNLWYSIVHLLQNAFVRAIVPAIDNEISLASVDTEKHKKKTLLQQIFSRDKDKKEKKK